MNYPVLFILMVLLVFLLYLRKKQRQDDLGKKPANRKANIRAKNTRKPNDSAYLSEVKKMDAVYSAPETDLAADDLLNQQSNVELQESPLVESTAAQRVDSFTEYQVYKQFGNAQKAARSLKEYLDHTNEVPIDLVHELFKLCADSGDKTLLKEMVAKYQYLVPPQEVVKYAEIETAHSDRLRSSSNEVLDINFDQAQFVENNENLQINSLPNKVQTKMPDKKAVSLVEMLQVDHQNQDIESFSLHLWQLYYCLGENGKSAQERMLHWGYSLGYHEIFDELAKRPSEKELQLLGLKFGFPLFE